MGILYLKMKRIRNGRYYLMKLMICSIGWFNKNQKKF